MAKKVYREKETIVCDEKGEIKQRTIEAWAIAKGDQQFTKTFDLFHTKILNDLGSMNGEAKLLLYLLGLTKNLPINTHGWIHLDYRKTMNDLEISESTLLRYLKKLLDLGYIKQIGNKKTIFRIKPEYVYRGVLSEYWEKSMLEKTYPLGAIFVGTN